MNQVIERLEQLSRNIDEDISNALREVERVSSYFDNFTYTYIPNEGEMILLDKNSVNTLSDILNKLEHILGNIQQEIGHRESDDNDNLNLTPPPSLLYTLGVKKNAPAVQSPLLIKKVSS